MLSSDIAEKEVVSLKNRLIGFNRKLYKDLWIKNAKEHEDPERIDLDLDSESESATYYFDYIYEHGEHPR
jgi:hypothetical protein